MGDDKRHWGDTETLARVLISGRLESSEEGPYREAISLLLRGGQPLSQNFRDDLAALFDPDGFEPGEEYSTSPRKLVVVQRSAGNRQSNPLRNTSVAMRVFRAIEAGEPIEKAQHEAADHFHLSFERVRQIWRDQKAMITHLHGSPVIK